MFIIYQRQLTRRKLGFQFQPEQIAARTGGETIVRHKRDAKADIGQIHQQIIGTQFDFRNQIQLVLLESGCLLYTSDAADEL